MDLRASRPSTSTASRTFIVTGLRFSKDSYDAHLKQHLRQFGEICLEYKEPNNYLQTVSTNSKVAFLNYKEPIFPQGPTLNAYAIATFLTEEGANACAMYPGKHFLNGLRYEVKIRRLTDMQKGNETSRVYSSKIMLTPGSLAAVDSITEDAICATFQPYGEIVGIEIPSKKANKPKCWFVEFAKPASVNAVMMLDHSVATHAVRIRRVLRMEDLKKEAQRERERKHREEWIEQRASTSKTLDYNHVRDRSREFATVSKFIGGSSEAMSNYGYGTEDQFCGNANRIRLSPPPPPPPASDFSQYGYF